jgi:hypothetical protein
MPTVLAPSPIREIVRSASRPTSADPEERLGMVTERGSFYDYWIHRRGQRGAGNRTLRARPGPQGHYLSRLLCGRPCMSSASDIRVSRSSRRRPEFQFRRRSSRMARQGRELVSNLCRRGKCVVSRAGGTAYPDRCDGAGVAFGGGFELALACDFLVVAQSSVLRCVEVTTAMLPNAGALQCLAERVGRARASRYSMLVSRSLEMRRARSESLRMLRRTQS